MKHNYLLFAIVLSFAVISCGEKYDCEDLEMNVGDMCDDNDANTEDDLVTADCNCEGTEIPVTYTNAVKAIMDGSCAFSGCHAGGTPAGGFALETYDQVSGAAGFGRMIGAINHESGFTPMPPSGTKIDQADIDAITEWIDNGTPE